MVKSPCSRTGIHHRDGQERRSFFFQRFWYQRPSHSKHVLSLPSDHGHFQKLNILAPPRIFTCVKLCFKCQIFHHSLHLRGFPHLALENQCLGTSTKWYCVTTTTTTNFIENWKYHKSSVKPPLSNKPPLFRGGELISPPLSINPLPPPILILHKKIND